MSRFTIGADPEFFLRDRITGHMVSAHDMLPGTKEAPHAVPKGAVQVDGVACEFNIDPANNEDEFVDNIKTVLDWMRRTIPDRYDFVFNPVARFERVYFEGLPFQAVQLGCTPDFNAYNYIANPVPDPQGEPFRTASGHVHIGWHRNATDLDEEHHRLCAYISRNLDWHLGIPSLNWDRDGSDRRKLYGKAGCFRPKPYGVEYRVLSIRSEILMRRVYRGAVEGTADFFNNRGDCTFMKKGTMEPQRLLA